MGYSEFIFCLKAKRTNPLFIHLKYAYRDTNRETRKLESNSVIVYSGSLTVSAKPKF
jgi:hypothetical protein